MVEDPLEVAQRVREILSQQIESYDKMTDDYRDFPVDREAYNIVAHALRSVRTKLDDWVKEYKKKVADARQL